MFQLIGAHHAPPNWRQAKGFAGPGVRSLQHRYTSGSASRAGDVMPPGVARFVDSRARKSSIGQVSVRVGNEFRHIESDAAGTDDRDFFADGFSFEKRVDVADDVIPVRTIEVEPARRNTCRDDDMLEALGFQIGGGRARI